MSEAVVDLGNMLERAVDEALQAMLPPDILNDRKAMALVRKQLAMKWITQSEAASFLNKRGAIVQPPDPGDLYLARSLRIMECRVKNRALRKKAQSLEDTISFTTGTMMGMAMAYEKGELPTRGDELYQRVTEVRDILKRAFDNITRDRTA